jgi:hypothetical protein
LLLLFVFLLAFLAFLACFRLGKTEDGERATSEGGA